ncbi:MAG: HDOD domain-containing protein [Desulfobacterales bacterium]|jgi:HD-like signal output (HDOD) protein
MIIECSNCTKKFKIQEDRLPQDKIVAFPCKNCGEKIRLDLRIGQTVNEPSNEPDPGSAKLAQTPPQTAAETEQEKLKDKILKSVKELPPMPQVIIKTQEVISDSKADAKKIAEVIETDQSIATKVLKVANSAYFGMSGKISSISHASVVLGHKILEEIVTLAGAEGILAGKLPGYGYDSQDLWKHSLAVAFASKIIANSKNPGLVKEAHMTGLIHDVGKIILDSYIVEKKAEIESFMETEEKTFFEAESQYLGFNHADIASDVCKKWNFPESINIAIKYHHQPAGSEGNELCYILHMADYIATLSGIGYDSDDILYELEEGTMDYLRFSNENVSEIVLQVTESVNKISV